MKACRKDNLIENRSTKKKKKKIEETDYDKDIKLIKCLWHSLCLCVCLLTGGRDTEVGYFYYFFFFITKLCVDKFCSPSECNTRTQAHRQRKEGRKASRQEGRQLAKH